MSSFTDFLGDLESNPLFAKAFREAEERMKRSVDVRCAWGTCVDFYDPVGREITGGIGDPLCGCDSLPGWRSKHPEGKPKPGWGGKARGRHGSRVQRSRHRRREWERFVAEFNHKYGKVEA